MTLSKRVKRVSSGRITQEPMYPKITFEQAADLVSVSKKAEGAAREDDTGFRGLSRLCGNRADVGSRYESFGIAKLARGRLLIFKLDL